MSWPEYIDSLGSKDPKHVRPPLCVSQGALQAAPGSNVRVSRLNITFTLQCRHRVGASVDHGFWGGYYYAWSFVYRIFTCFIEGLMQMVSNSSQRAKIFSFWTERLKLANSLQFTAHRRKMRSGCPTLNANIFIVQRWRRAQVLWQYNTQSIFEDRLSPPRGFFLWAGGRIFGTMEVQEQSICWQSDEAVCLSRPVVSPANILTLPLDIQYSFSLKLLNQWKRFIWI